jgi:hypothetical protein
MRSLVGLDEPLPLQDDECGQDVKGGGCLSPGMTIPGGDRLQFAILQ